MAPRKAHPLAYKKAALEPHNSPHSEETLLLGSETPGVKMSRLSTFVSRPRDLNCCFWDILLLLAGEPAFEFLREVLSAPPDEASSVDSPHRADAFVAETSEGGSEAAAPPGKTRTAEDLPRAEETRGHPGLPDDGKWR